MTKDRVIGSYLLRFTESKNLKHIHLHNLKTGEVIEFETWVSAWAFLDQNLEIDVLASQSPQLFRHAKGGTGLKACNANQTLEADTSTHEHT